MSVPRSKVGPPRLSNAFKFAVVVVVVNLHLLRNVSLPLYISVYGAVGFMVLIASIARLGKRRIDFTLPAIWFVIGVMGFFVSCFIIGLFPAAYGASRFFFAMPVLLGLFLFTADRDDLVKNLRFMGAFFAFATLSLPFQFFTGPISWFADGSERAGLERFSSLVGSLTAIGYVAGSYLALMSVQRPRSRWVLAGIIIVCCAASLSKAAMANVVLGVVGLLWLHRKQLSRSVVGSGVLGALVFIALNTSASLRTRFEVTLSSFGFKVGDAKIASYDQTFEESAWARLTELPRANFEALADLASPLVYLVGGGFGMASTALVPEGSGTAPMAHNQYAELITVFGFLGGGVLVGVMVAVWIRLWRRRDVGEGTLVRAVLVAYGLLLLNSFFANGTVHQPAAASVFLAAMFVASVPEHMLSSVGTSGASEVRKLRARVDPVARTA